MIWVYQRAYRGYPKGEGDHMYYNYHAQAKRLIQEGHLTHYVIVDRWNHIAPALVLYFDNHRPMPIREERWSEYLRLM